MRARELGFLKFSKAFIFFGLSFAFCLNNYCNLQDFSSEKETRSTRLVHVEKGLELPAITICNKTAYKNIERNLKLKDYLQNTIELNDFFVRIYYADLDKDWDKFLEEYLKETKRYTIKPTFSLTKGRCYTIYFDKLNPGITFASVKVKAPKTLQVFVHEAGEEIWFNGPVSNWPKSIQFGSEGAMDISLQAHLHIKGGNCIEDPDYDYFGCIKNGYANEREKQGPNCTTPWSQSAIGKYDYIDSQPCNGTQFDKELEFSQFYFGVVHIKICPESCKETKYEFVLDEMSLYVGADLAGGAIFPLEEIREHQIVNIFYKKNKVLEIEDIPILSFWGFVSSCGGSLGLFLGFSCYGTISSLIDSTKERMKL